MGQDNGISHTWAIIDDQTVCNGMNRQEPLIFTSAVLESPNLTIVEYASIF
jgi:hypothetical protein